jgi:DNA-directed RNA polymerase subunit omega
MARVTVEDCLREVSNRFALVHLAAQRVRQYRQGAKPNIESKNKEVVVSLREVAAHRIEFEATSQIIRPAKIAPGALDVPAATGSVDPDED